MSAMVTGVKTNAAFVSVNQDAIFNDYRSSKGKETESIVELAEKRRKSTGVISTARLTHATPAACYAHSPNRSWEDDSDLQRTSPESVAAGAKDIARQLIEFPYGDGVDVAMGGGRRSFIPESETDPEYQSVKGKRKDGRDLTKEWLRQSQRSAYVWNKSQFDAVDPERTEKLLGLFEPSHMRYEYDRPQDGSGEPSLAEMTRKAIRILSKNKRGFVLVVEAGRIDHAHHRGNAFRALTDTIELSNAVRAATEEVDLSKTMIVVTADHSHGLTLNGYPSRGNNILGLTKGLDSTGNPEKEAPKAIDGKPYTTLRYSDGPGSIVGAPRPDIDQKTVTDPNYKQQSTVPKPSDSHTGEDVAIFATGVNSWMFSGSMEQHWIYYIMRDALRL